MTENKTDLEWLAETIDSRPLTKEKLRILGLLGLKKIAPLLVESFKENQDV